MLRKKSKLWLIWYVSHLTIRTLSAPHNSLFLFKGSSVPAGGPSPRKTQMIDRPLSNVNDLPLLRYLQFVVPLTPTETLHCLTQVSVYHSGRLSDQTIVVPAIHSQLSGLVTCVKCGHNLCSNPTLWQHVGIKHVVLLGPGPGLRDHVTSALHGGGGKTS